MEVDGAEKSQARCGAWGSGPAQGHGEEADLRADAYLAAGGSRCGGELPCSPSRPELGFRAALSMAAVMARGRRQWAWGEEVRGGGVGWGSHGEGKRKTERRAREMGIGLG